MSLYCNPSRKNKLNGQKIKTTASSYSKNNGLSLRKPKPRSKVEKLELL
jgi:hypothetical protein